MVSACHVSSDQSRLRWVYMSAGVAGSEPNVIAAGCGDRTFGHAEDIPGARVDEKYYTRLHENHFVLFHWRVCAGCGTSQFGGLMISSSRSNITLMEITLATPINLVPGLPVLIGTAGVCWCSTRR